MFKSKVKPTVIPSVTIPPIGDISPALAEIEAKSAELGKEASELRAEALALSRDEEPEDADAARDVRVAEILGRKPPTVQPRRSERMQQITVRLRDIEAAREVLARERETEKRRATSVLRDRLMPEYRKQMRGLIDALITANAAQVAIRGLASKVEDAGYLSSWMDAHPARWMDIGPTGNAGRFVREKMAEGYIAERDVPEELK